MTKLLTFVGCLLVALGLGMKSEPHQEGPTLHHAELVPAQYRASFIDQTIRMANRLHIEPDWIMTCMKFETAGTFRANIRNKYSGAVGLIQFLPTTARRLGTTPNKLAAMTPTEQLVIVEKYFQPYAGRMSDVYDVYLVIFAPAFLGRSQNTALYRANAPDALGRRRYSYNRVLDGNKDGVITIRDVKRQIRPHLK